MSTSSHCSIVSGHRTWEHFPGCHSMWVFLYSITDFMARTQSHEQSVSCSKHFPVSKFIECKNEFIINKKKLQKSSYHSYIFGRKKYTKTTQDGDGGGGGSRGSPNKKNVSLWISHSYSHL